MSFLVSLVRPIAYVSLPVLLLRSSPVGQYYTRAVLYLSSMSAVATCAIAIAAGMASVGRKYDVNYVIAKIFYAVTSRLLDLHIDVEGQSNLDNNQPAVLMVNHQSMLDVLVVGRLMPKRTSIMSKESLRYSPMGPFMSLSGAIFINRGNNAAAIQSLASAAQKMKSEKVSVWMFPEGTRRLDPKPDILPLKKGGFHFAVQAGIPIIPIVTENYWRLYRPGAFLKGRMKVRVLPPIPTAGLTTADIPELVDLVHKEMLAALHDLSRSSSRSENEAPHEDSEKRDESTPIPAERQLSTDSVAPFPGAFKARPTGISDSQATISAATSASLSASGAQLDPGSNLSLSSLVSGSETSSSGTGNLSESFSHIDADEDDGMILVARP